MANHKAIQAGASRRTCIIPALIGLVLCLSPNGGLAQAPIQVEPGAGGLEKYWYLEKNTWHVFGRVTDIRGDPLREVTVRVGIGSINDEPRVLKTNLKGEFSTEYSLDANAFRKLNVKVVASMSGYALAREAADYTLDGKTSGIHLVLRETKEDPDQLSMAALIERLGPRLREEAAKQPGVEPDRKEFVRGCEELLDRHNAVGAVAPLSRVVERAASCVPCRLLLSLALLDSGSWAGGTRQLQEATKLNEAAAAKQPEPGLIGGVLDAWRGDAGAAAGSFLKALEIDPNHALGLQEMGRVLVAQKNWEAAEQYLERALRAGAGAEIRLLRVRALLGVGDVVEADREMNQYVGGRDVKTLPLEARTLYLQVQERLELVPFAKVKSVISESPRELVKGMPELAGLEVAPNQDALELVLKKTGEGVEAFFRNFPNTVSVEQIHQERLGKDGKVKSSLDQEFQYLLLAHAEKWGLGVDEHRSTARGNIAGLHGLNQGLMLTSGFASVSLHFHPAYRDGATFRYLGRQRINGEDVHVVAFAQKPATARMTQRFISDEGSAVLLLQGLAWIDPTTFQIVRLHTDLLAPQSKVRLQRQTTEIQFKEVSFKEVARALWLPEEVAVTVDWRGRIYRNQHRYSDFKLFNVEAKEERKTPIAPTPETQGQAR